MRSSEPAAARPAPPLRVLVVAHNAVAASNRRRVDALAALPGLRVALLTPRWWFEEGRRVQAPPDAPWRVGRTAFTNNGSRYLYLDALPAMVRRLRPDVIDLHEEPFSLVALQTLLARDLLAPRAALVFYSAVNVHRRWRLPYHLVERLVLARADGAHGPNREVAAILRRKGFAGPLRTIPLGVDLARFAAPPGPRPARPRVGFLGRLEPVKGLDVLLDAAARLSHPAEVVVAGDGPERPRLVARARALGLEGRVAFASSVPYADVPGFLRGLDLLVLPSVTILPLHKEQFGRVLAEAMAAGVPVVGSDSGAIPEVVGDAGVVVPERDPAALAAALDRLLADPRLRADLAERGRRRAAACFAWPVVAEQTADLYRAALAAHRRSAAAAVGAAA